MASSENIAGQAGNRAECLWQVARHDFRQPVQSLELLASAMASARTAKARRQCADRTVDLAAALRSMIEGLSLVSRLEAGEVTPAPVAVPLAGAVTAAIEALGGHGVGIEVRGLDGIAHADTALLGAMLEGLLLYAVKFAAAGPVIVTTTAQKRGAAIELGFEGRHPRSALAGMAFVELPPAGEGASPAVGLGPALIARMASVLGWRLELTATTNAAARVRLSLPAQAPA